MVKHFNREGHSGFLESVSVRLICKKDGKDPKMRGNYWIGTPMCHLDLPLKVVLVQQIRDKYLTNSDILHITQFYARNQVWYLGDSGMKFAYICSMGNVYNIQTKTYVAKIK